jgi:hypothetical protein
MADPTLYLYTSLTAGSSHIITATSRLETILKANKIPFRALDVATDDKARSLWGRRSRGRKLPGLVKFGQVIGVCTVRRRTRSPPLTSVGPGSDRRMERIRRATRADRVCGRLPRRLSRTSQPQRNLSATRACSWCRKSIDTHSAGPWRN